MVAEEADFADVATRLLLDNTREYIGGIVPAVGAIEAAICRQVVIEFIPAHIPPLRHTNTMDDGRRIGEDACLLIARLVEPFDLNAWT